MQSIVAVISIKAEGSIRDQNCSNNPINNFEAGRTEHSAPDGRPPDIIIFVEQSGATFKPGYSVNLRSRHHAGSAAGLADCASVGSIFSAPHSISFSIMVS